MTQDDDLDSFFAAARDTAPAPSDALMARVLADASLHQPSPETWSRAAPPARSFWEVLGSALGRGGALAGMVSATVAGVYLGFSQPVGDGLFALLNGTESVTIDMMPGIDALLDEAP